MLYVDFVKMHGLLNSFILVSDFSQLFSPIESVSLAQAICSTQGGVGADGLVLLRPGQEEVDFIMDFYNADGSKAEMCGNAVRCMAKYIKDEKLLSSKDSKETGVTRLNSEQKEAQGVKFLTPSGIITTRLIDNQEWSAVVSVDMGNPVFNPLKKYTSPQGQFTFRNYSFIPVSMGNPHVVTFLSSEQDWNLNYHELALALQKEDFFPDGVNVEFVRVIKDGELEVRVIERGVGETMACGTGACAVVAAYVRSYSKNQLDSIKVHLLGGSLTINWRGGDQDSIEMIGPVKKIAVGNYFFEEGL